MRHFWLRGVLADSTLFKEQEYIPSKEILQASAEAKVGNAGNPLVSRSAPTTETAAS
ncbi:unnamed protein product, partial [Ilex paraguariensis]